MDFSIFVGMPLIVLCAVCAITIVFAFPMSLLLDGSNLYCILNCGSNDLCHIKRKRTMIMHGKVVKDYR